MSLVPSVSFLCSQVDALLRSLDDLNVALALPIGLSADAAMVEAATVETVTVEAATVEAVPLAGQATEGFNAESIHSQITQLQQSFHQLLQAMAQADLSLVDCDPAVGQRLRTYQTEAHRRVRLLGVEAMRLRTAKQPMTLARSRSQLQAHVAQLEQFMQAMADEVCSL